MQKLTNYYALLGLKCLHLLATVLWCGGTIAAILLHYTVALTSDAESILHLYLIRPGIWTLIITGAIYTLFTNFSCKQRWIRAKWVITFATAITGMLIASVPIEDFVKLLLMTILLLISVYHFPKNKLQHNA